MFRLKHINIILIAVVVILGGSFYKSITNIDAADYQSAVKASEPIKLIARGDVNSEDVVSLPKEFNLDMEFHPQAPFGNWGDPYQEACEEASLLLAYNYVNGISVSREEFDILLNEMVKWEMDEFGKYKDTPLEQVAIIAKKYLNYSKFEIVEDPSIKQIKEFLVQGYPVIAPMSGQDLGNPFFTNDGPIFHALIIRGYEEGGFITNDVGTRHGENFVYPEEVIMDALHDWDSSFKKTHSDMIQGSKKILVIKS